MAANHVSGRWRATSRASAFELMGNMEAELGIFQHRGLLSREEILKILLRKIGSPCYLFRFCIFCLDLCHVGSCSQWNESYSVSGIRILAAL